MRTKEYFLLTTCVGTNITNFKWLMKGTRPCSGSRLRNEIKRHLPTLYDELCLQYYNPFEHRSRRKKGLAVYVHSGIEYFIQIN